MKILVSKKTSVIFTMLGVILVLSSVLGGYYLYERNVIINGQYELDKYREETELCTREGFFGKLNFRCEGYIDIYQEKDGRDCFSMALLSPEKELYYKEICEPKDSIEWDRGTMISEKKVPVFVEFSYSRPMFGGYVIDSIKYTLMSDEEIQNFAGKLVEERIPVPHLRTQLEEDLEYKGYYLSNELEVAGGGGLSFFVLFSASIKEVAVLGDNLSITVQFSNEGKEYESVFVVKSVMFQKDMSTNYISLDVSNIQDYEFSDSSQILLMYLGEDTNLRKEEILSYCSSGNILAEFFSICSIVEDINIDSYRIANAEEYFRSSLEKNADGFVDLDKFLLSGILFRL